MREMIITARYTVINPAEMAEVLDDIQACSVEVAVDIEFAAEVQDPAQAALIKDHNSRACTCGAYRKTAKCDCRDFGHG